MAETFGDEREDIIRLFGTANLPTSFTGRALPDVVRRDIQRLNPDYEIKIERPDGRLA